MDKEPVFGRPSFPKNRPPTVKELFQEAKQTEVRKDYTKNFPKEIIETNYDKRHVTNTMLIKQSMSALMRNAEKKNLKNKIQKTDRHFVSEKEDNFREHIFDSKTQSWKFNYKDSALDRNNPSGYFVMSKLAASTLCESGAHCPLHNPVQTNLSKIPHVQESESVKATISPENEKDRENDFEGINIELNKSGSNIQENKVANIERGTEEELFYPNVISSSFIRKTRINNLDEFIKVAYK